VTAITRGLPGYGLATVGIIAGAGALLAVGFRGPGDMPAIVLSAGVVLALQLITFSILTLVPERQIMAGWGVGTLLRLVTLVAYGFLVAKVLAMPVVAALISMATFLFLSTLIEPLFLRK
jgi:hypothetical protein